MQSPPSDQTTGTITTLHDLLTTEKPPIQNQPITTTTNPWWTALKPRVLLRPLSWCGPATWQHHTTPPLSASEDNTEEEEEEEEEDMDGDNGENNAVSEVVVGMDLAAALAAERAAEMVVVVEEGNDRVCCVCMGRKKGAAMIPCGHTYCRVCCKELWHLRGSCPLCNRLILDILHIY